MAKHFIIKWELLQAQIVKKIRKFSLKIRRSYEKK